MVGLLDGSGEAGGSSDLGVAAGLVGVVLVGRGVRGGVWHETGFDDDGVDVAGESGGEVAVEVGAGRTS